MPPPTGGCGDIELHRERVVVRRSLAGMRMALNMPVAAFDGISLQLVPGEGGEADRSRSCWNTGSVADAAALSDIVTDEALAEWRAWSEVLDVPLLLASSRRGRGKCAAWRTCTSSAPGRAAAAEAR